MSGRNELCSCGSGKKYKKCHGAPQVVPKIVPVRPEDIAAGRVPKEVLEKFALHQLREKQRTSEFGDVRPIIHAEFAGHQVIAVGGEIHWSKTWKTFPDFLQHFIKKKLGAEWGNAELAKPLEERHPVLQWYEAMCELQRRSREAAGVEKGEVFSSELDGPSRAYMLLAYELYVLSDNMVLLESLLKRLRDPAQFQGARYEVFVCATMVRAGFKIEHEDETDSGQKHTEFVAIHKATGARVAVEAKSRHRRGVLGAKHGRKLDPPESFRVGIRDLFRSAVAKSPGIPYFIFIDGNMPPEVAVPTTSAAWIAEVRETALAEGVTTASGDAAPQSAFNALFVTNTPDHYVGPGAPPPQALGYSTIALSPLYPMPVPGLVEEVERALMQAPNIPIHFPESQ